MLLFRRNSAPITGYRMVHGATVTKVAYLCRSPGHTLYRELLLLRQGQLKS